MRTGPALSRNRMARVKTQAPLGNFNLPLRTRREIENNRSQPPIVSFNHLQNLLGMCRRINAQSLLKERKKNPHDPCLYPVYLRRPVARPSTPACTLPASATPRRASSAGTKRRHRHCSTPPSAPVSRPITPPVSARKRPHTARPAIDDPPIAYAPRRFTLLLDISNRPATLGPPPAFATRPPSAASTPRPGSSRSQKGESCSKPADQQPTRKPHPNVPSLKKLPVDRATPKLASDRTFDRSSQQSGSMSSFGPMAAAYFSRRPHSAGDHRPLSAGDVPSERPMSRRQAGPSASRAKPVSESQTRSIALRDLSESTSTSSPPGRASPTSSSSSSSRTDGSTTTMPDTVRSEATALSNVKGKDNLWSHANPNADERPPSRRGAKPFRKKKGLAAPSETTLSTTTTTEPSIAQEVSENNTSAKTSGASTLRNGIAHAKRTEPGVAPLRTRSFVQDGVDSGLKTPRAKADPSIAEAKISARRASNLSGGSGTPGVKLQEPMRPAPAPSSEELSPGRPKVSFAASDTEERKQGKQPMIEIMQSTLDQALDRLETSKHTERKAEAASSEDFTPTMKGSALQHGAKLQEPDTQAIWPKQLQSMAIDTASGEDVDVRDSTDEDSIRTLTCILSGSSSEMSQTEPEEENQDEDVADRHRAHLHNMEDKRDFSAVGTRNLREALQQQLPEEREQVDAQEEVMGCGDIPSSVFIKFSADAYVDFKNSMMNLIRNDKLENGPDEALEDLFQYYIDLNPPVHHGVLREVIADIKVELKRVPRC